MPSWRARTKNALTRSSRLESSPAVLTTQVKRAFWREVERDGQLGVHGAIQRELGRGGEGELHLALRHVGQDFFGVGGIAFDPGEIRVFQPEVLQRPLVGAGCPDLDLATTGVHDAGRAGGTASVHQVLTDALVARSELDAPGQGDTCREACRSDVGPACGDFIDRGLPGFDRVQAQGYAQVFGKLTGQVVGRAFGAMAAEVVRVRAVAGDHPEFAVSQDPLQQRGRLGTGGQQQRRQQCE